MQPIRPFLRSWWLPRGHSFNPVSFYYCFDPAGKRVDAIVADVRNIPWGERLVVQIESRPRQDRGGRSFDATLSPRRRELDRARLTGLLVRYRAMSLQVVGRIYSEALRLRLKGARCFPHPDGSRPRAFVSP